MPVLSYCNIILQLKLCLKIFIFNIPCNLEVVFGRNQKYIKTNIFNVLLKIFEYDFQAQLVS